MDELEIFLCKDRFSKLEVLNFLIYLFVQNTKENCTSGLAFVLQGAVCGIHVFGLTKSKVKIFLDVRDIWLLPICKYEVRKMGFHLCTSTTSTIAHVQQHQQVHTYIRMCLRRRSFHNLAKQCGTQVFLCQLDQKIVKQCVHSKKKTMCYCAENGTEKYLKSSLGQREKHVLVKLHRHNNDGSAQINFSFNSTTSTNYGFHHHVCLVMTTLHNP